MGCLVRVFVKTWKCSQVTGHHFVHIFILPPAPYRPMTLNRGSVRLARWGKTWLSKQYPPSSYSEPHHTLDPWTHPLPHPTERCSRREPLGWKRYALRVCL